MNSQVFENLHNLRGALNNAHLEREHIIDGLLASIISKQNAFLLGAPGTGKSDLVRSMTNAIGGARYFGYLLSPTSDPSELFGPVKITKLMEDEYSRDTEGYLPSAHIAFLDELFRGNSAVLNSLLTVLNERQFYNGKEIIQTPLQSIVAATNSWPEEESLQAFSDRFLFRPTVDFLRKPANRSVLDQWSLGLKQRPQVGVMMTLQDLFMLQEEAQKLPVTEDFLEKFSGVWDHLQTRGIRVSDRRRVQILRFLQAYAVVQGDSQLMPFHMHNTLEHVAYTNAEDQEVIRDVLIQEVQTAEREIAKIKRGAADLMAKFQGLMNGADIVKQAGVTAVGDLNERVRKLDQIARDMQRLDAGVNAILDGTAGFHTSANATHAAMRARDILQVNSQKIARAQSELRGGM